MRATFYLLVTIENPVRTLVTIENPVRTRSHRQQIEPLDIQSYLPPGTFRMVILPMPARFGWLFFLCPDSSYARRPCMEQIFRLLIYKGFIFYGFNKVHNRQNG